MGGMRLRRAPERWRSLSLRVSMIGETSLRRSLPLCEIQRRVGRDSARMRASRLDAGGSSTRMTRLGSADHEARAARHRWREWWFQGEGEGALISSAGGLAERRCARIRSGELRASLMGTAESLGVAFSVREMARTMWPRSRAARARRWSHVDLPSPTEAERRPAMKAESGGEGMDLERVAHVVKRQRARADGSMDC